MTVLERMRLFAGRCGESVVCDGTPWRYYRLGTGPPVLAPTGHAVHRASTGRDAAVHAPGRYCVRARQPVAAPRASFRRHAMATLVEIEHLTKSYGRSRGIVDVLFAIPEGEIFGFLGPNGAGKTTLIRVLLGLLHPTAGAARIAGLDCWRDSVAARHLVGYLPGEWSFDPAMTGAAILQYLAHLRGDVDQAYLRRLVARLDLDPGRRFREYSHGNRQKVGLVQAFMGQPRLLVLDEPTSGLDPLAQQIFNDLVAEARAAGSTIFLSSHILSEVEHTCDRVGIIREGRLVKVAALADLKEIRAHTLTLTFAAPARADWFTGLPGVLAATLLRDGREVRLTVQGDLPEVILAAGRRGAINVATSEPTLEEIFLRFYAPEREVAAAA